MAEMSVLCAYEAEQAVLGGLMLENERWDEVVLILNPDDFYVAQHRAIFRAMSELAVNGQPLDLITLSEHLEHQGSCYIHYALPSHLHLRCLNTHTCFINKPKR